MIEINHLYKSYGQQVVLDDINLSIQEGVITGLLGPNGCGKTTLLDLLAGLRRPQKGRIVFQGRSLTSFHRQTLAREIALVPQNFYVNFPFNVQDVVMMGRYPHLKRFARPGAEDLRLVAEAMDATDTNRFARQPVTALSGGERQRVIFARALAQDAGVIFTGGVGKIGHIMFWESTFGVRLGRSLAEKVLWVRGAPLTYGTIDQNETTSSASAPVPAPSTSSRPGM